MRIRRKWLGIGLTLAILLVIVVLGNMWLDRGAEARTLAHYRAITIGMSQDHVHTKIMGGSYFWSGVQATEIYNSFDGRFMFLVVYEPPPGKHRIASWADQRPEPDWIVRQKQVMDLKRAPLNLDGLMSTVGLASSRLSESEVKKPDASTVKP